MNATVAAPRATRREWIGLAVIALPCLLYSMNLTVIRVICLRPDAIPEAVTTSHAREVFNGFAERAGITVEAMLAERARTGTFRARRTQPTSQPATVSMPEPEPWFCPA